MRDTNKAKEEAAHASSLSRGKIAEKMNALVNRYGIKIMNGQGAKITLATLTSGIIQKRWHISLN